MNYDYGLLSGIWQNDEAEANSALSNLLQALAPVHLWKGASGTWYRFSVYECNSVPYYDGANYILTKKISDDYYQPIYIGETNNCATRFSGHEKMLSALLHGMTHIHIHASASVGERLKIETDLRQQFWTPLNEQPTRAEPILYGLGNIFA